MFFSSLCPYRLLNSFALIMFGEEHTYFICGLFVWIFVPRPALGPTQPPVQWVPGFISPGVKRGRGVTRNTHRHLVPKSRMSRNYISSPPGASMACSGTTLDFRFIYRCCKRLHSVEWRVWIVKLYIMYSYSNGMSVDLYWETYSCSHCLFSIVLDVSLLQSYRSPVKYVPSFEARADSINAYASSLLGRALIPLTF
jgi:hypothetical protein